MVQELLEYLKNMKSKLEDAELTLDILFK
jgi:hypothetical protein